MRSTSSGIWLLLEAHYPLQHAHLHLLEALHVSRGRHPDWAPMLHHTQVATRLASYSSTSLLAPALIPLLCRTLPRACATLRVLSQRYSTWASQEQSELSITPRYLYCFTTGSGSVPHSRAPSGRGGACSGANTMAAVLAGPMLACMRHLLHQARATVMPCCSSPGDSAIPMKSSAKS
jgi:hypothetical protein